VPVATYLDMQTRIADELDRSDLTAQIKKAIISAVAHYERRRFYFCETSFTISTVAGQETYTSSDAAAIATSPNIERLNGLYSNLRTPLTKRDWAWIDDVSSTTTSRARPMAWAYRAETIRLYPIPDAAYTITAYNVPRLTALSADGDSNAWTNDAEELIRSHAKIDLLRNVIRGADMVEEIALQRDQEQGALAALIRETSSREALGHTVPSVF
jgi:hypothetical protein